MDKHIVIYDNRITKREIRTIVNTMHLNTSQPKCKRCGTINNIMLNGYCVDCEEELQSQTK